MTPLTKVQQATRQLARGNRAQALLVYDEVAPQAGDDARLNVQLGHLCSELGDFDKAVTHFDVALRREPDNAHYVGYLGIACQQAGQTERAQDALEQAVRIDGGTHTVLHCLGVIFLGRRDYVQAYEYLENARQKKPGDANVLVNLATTMVHLDRHAEALEHARKAMKQQADDPGSHYAVGRILTELGRTEEAVVHLEKMIRRFRTFGAAYDLLARIRKFTPADKPIVERAEKALKESMSAQQRFSLHYALGKIYDDLQAWDSAFEHYRQANLLQKKDYDIRPERKLFRKLRKALDRPAIEELLSHGHPSELPVFVVGMPRSGTTLIERIIASHPQAAGAGELPELPRIARALAPETPGTLDGQQLREHAGRYLDVLTRGREDAVRVVDSLPDNFFHLGLIAVLFPNATIVHVTRHPLDTCLSCYFQNFTNVRWANELPTIGEKYLFCREVVDHWTTVLQAGRILEVSYEQLVDDPETQIRRLVTGCGLPWDERSLEFHKDAGVVRSASLWQVRQPIYRSSKMRWTHYASHIGELADTLAPLLEPRRDELAEHGIELPAPSAIGRLRRIFG